MLPDAENTLEKYLHLGETQELSEANEFNPQGQTTASVHALRYPMNKCKVKAKPQINYAHIVVLVIKLVNAQLKRQSEKICQKTAHYAKVCWCIYRKKQNEMMTGQIISLLDLQQIRGKTPIFTWWQMKMKS